jgi:hypothetical protein
MGEGQFTPGILNAKLELCLKSSQTSVGNIVPAVSMQIGEFQSALAATRAEWAVDEVLA